MNLKRFFSGFAKVFKSPAMQIAGPILAQGFVPALGPILQYISGLIADAEDKFGSETGPQKFEDVTTNIANGTALIVTLIEKATGKELVDEELLHKGLRGLVGPVVDILNAFGIFPKAVKG